MLILILLSMVVGFVAAIKLPIFVLLLIWLIIAFIVAHQDGLKGAIFALVPFFYSCVGVIAGWAYYYGLLL
jgi:hypothetical protein